MTYTQYVLNTLPIIGLCVPIYAVIRAVYLRSKKIAPSYHREAGLFLFTLYLIWLATQTIIPNISVVEDVWMLGHPGFGEVNLELFKVFKQTYAEVFGNGNASYFFINFIGNILVFIPISFFSLLLFKTLKKPLIASLLRGLVLSLFIEFVQFFIERGCDIDDLWLNTLGALLGYFLYAALNKRFGGFFSKFKPYAASKELSKRDI